MYSLNNCNKYYLYQGYARMSLGIDGLYRLVRSEMKGLSPISGDAFIFFGKARKSVKDTQVGWGRLPAVLQTS